MLALKPVTEDRGRLMVRARGPPTSQVPCASWVFRPPARMHVILLGPCFKTGRLEAFRQRPEGAVPGGLAERPSFLGRPGDMGGLATPAVVPPGQPTLTSAQRIQPSRPARRLPARTRGLQSLPPQQFQALFDSLFKVLFIFPSRYLFAIGLPSVFSLR